VVLPKKHVSNAVSLGPNDTKVEVAFIGKNDAVLKIENNGRANHR
jgi:hypothetical protein